MLLSLIATCSFSQTENELYWSNYIESKQIKIGLINYKSLSFEKAYRIWTEYQVVELIMLTDSTYYGSLTNFVSKRKGKNKSETVFQKIKIPDRIVEKLIKTLQSQNIETLKDCKEVDGYPEGCGQNYIFEIGKEKTRRVYTYWEPENKNQNPELSEIKNVRNILASINSEFNLWEYFVKFRDRLPSGNYSYGMISMVKS